MNSEYKKAKLGENACKGFNLSRCLHLLCLSMSVLMCKSNLSHLRTTYQNTSKARMSKSGTTLSKGMSELPKLNGALNY